MRTKHLKKLVVFCICFFLSMQMSVLLNETEINAASKITVKFNANGGKVKTKSKKVTKKKAYGTLPSATRTGYSSKGWYTKKSGGTKKTKTSKVTSKKTHTLYAHWTAKQYTLTLNANGGTIKTKSKKVTYKKTYGTLPTPTRTGYTFSGWYTKKSGGTKKTKSSKVTTAKAHTLYAHWTAKKYKVTFNANGGTTKTKSKTVTYGSAYGTLPTPTRTNYTFSGWYTTKTGGTKKTKTTKVSTAKAHTLYAHWTGKASKVTFNANGGSVSKSSTTVNYASTYGTLPTPTRTGYTFSGWYTAQTGGSKISSTTKVTITKAQTLYARWTENTYNIKFDGNGNTSKSMSTMSGKKYTTSFALTKNEFELGDCTFKGWSTSKYGSVVYADGATVKGLTSVNGATVTLYAVWDGKTSDESLYEEAYSDFLSSTGGGWSKFSQAAALLSDEDQEGSIIPGLRYTNFGSGITGSTTMIPQGTCIAGDYQLISAYEEKGVYNSVIYVKDKTSKEYKTTIILDNNKCHVGALAYDSERQVVYIADSSKKRVWMLSMSTIDTAVASRRDTYTVSLNQTSDSFAVSTNPSFLTYYKGKLFVGNFDSVDEDNNYMYAYDENHKQTEIKIMLPLKSQGVSFVDYAGSTYMVCSCSYGRTKESYLYVYNINTTNDENWIKSDQLQKILTPNMSEDIDFAGDDFLYTCYESAANTYQYKSGSTTQKLEIGVTGFPIDRITVSSIAKLLGGTASSAKTSIKSSRNVALSVESVDTGSCGDNVSYTLYSDGVLNITGQGEMDNYSNQSAPWKDSMSEITSVSIGADVTSIGEEAFKGADNLETVTVSAFSDSEKSFQIEENAFADCDSLTEITLPDKEVQIEENAFPTEQENLEVVSDAKSVAEYCEQQDVSLHTHDFQYVKTIEPNCGTYGYDVYRCECGEEEYRNHKDIVGEHDFEIIEKMAPANGLPGSISYRCKTCGAYYAEEIE